MLGDVQFLSKSLSRLWNCDKLPLLACAQPAKSYCCKKHSGFPWLLEREAGLLRGLTALVAQQIQVVGKSQVHFCSVLRNIGVDP